MKIIREAERSRKDKHEEGGRIHRLPNGKYQPDAPNKGSDKGKTPQRPKDPSKGDVGRYHTHPFDEGDLLPDGQKAGPQNEFSPPDKTNASRDQDETYIIGTNPTTKKPEIWRWDEAPSAHLYPILRC